MEGGKEITEQFSLTESMLSKNLFSQEGIL